MEQDGSGKAIGDKLPGITLPAGKAGIELAGHFFLYVSGLAEIVIPGLRIKLIIPMLTENFI